MNRNPERQIRWLYSLCKEIIRCQDKCDIIHIRSTKFLNLIVKYDFLNSFKNQQYIKQETEDININLLEHTTVINLYLNILYEQKYRQNINYQTRVYMKKKKLVMRVSL